MGRSSAGRLINECWCPMPKSLADPFMFETLMTVTDGSSSTAIVKEDAVEKGESAQTNVLLNWIDVSLNQIQISTMTKTS